MKFCKNCGKEIEDGTKFCPSCGAAQEGKEGSDTSDLENKLKNLNNTADTTADFDPTDIESNKVMAILAYISWLVLIPLFAAKNSKFARYHCNQGIVLAIAEIICWILLGILDGLPLIGWLFGILNGLFSLVCLVFSVIGIMNAANGKAKELPFVGKYRILK